MLKKILCLMLAVSAVTLVSCGQNADVSSKPESVESSAVSESSVKKDLSDVKVEVGKAVETVNGLETKFTSEYKEPFVVLCEATSSRMDSVHSAYVFMENGEGMAHGYDTYLPYRCLSGDTVSKGGDPVGAAAVQHQAAALVTAAVHVRVAMFLVQAAVYHAQAVLLQVVASVAQPLVAASVAQPPAVASVARLLVVVLAAAVILPPAVAQAVHIVAVAVVEADTLEVVAKSL